MEIAKCPVCKREMLRRRERDWWAYYDVSEKTGDIIQHRHRWGQITETIMPWEDPLLVRVHSKPPVRDNSVIWVKRKRRKR
ncbi:MAG: hypothetical protein GY937_19975 [bacterium]|nr:hypothetical protein [bacterium]